MMLNVRAMDTYYGETQVLFGVSLTVAAGEIVALLGPSGAGKTTTLRSILGLTPARSGVVEWQGRDVTRWATHRISRLGIKWVPDDRRVFPTLSAARNLSIARRTSPFRPYSTADCCEIFPALRNLLPRECENMSGGELQMVSISRALAGGPGLVLFDEPARGSRRRSYRMSWARYVHCETKGSVRSWSIRTYAPCSTLPIAST